VFAPDARGHGESAKPHDPGAYANDAMVRDIQSLMDYASLEPVDVVGYSMGAIVAGRLAPRDPRVRSLVLGGVGGEWGGDQRPLGTEPIADALETESPDDIESRSPRPFGGSPTAPAPTGSRWRPTRGRVMERRRTWNRSRYRR